MIVVLKLVSWFIVVNRDREQREPDAEKLTQMKVMALLYYVQGTYLALYGKKAFVNDILAWQYGPAVAVVHQHFRGQRVLTHNVTPIDEMNYREVNSDDRLLRVAFEVQETFGVMKATALVTQTKAEKPWQVTPQSDVIDPECLRRYFREHIVKNDA
ncbi:DUF4065 domain-containing protein [Lentilactobacillus parafarraginis]|jgi:uncharacterized phage-associated protein|uniref:Toxin-antitoxin system, antitoxin component, Xre domain protein n=2 Tax=Lentilactobacillus parafarraginis TaxID=390842 RepID=A0A0R1YTE6_9LACO|nr:type II toxin-antitoxin system antitoxin SocA domain-containing protein [Lentilactobacillus parafarraginis]KRM45581.1 toxin-antitoxin system, antitoxin component, Xre domain protein [Lentilactobacillus parafarraginis DSM 18390 = JCM 14109]TLQ21145.1 DUF4065 domain-containing protein [Lentilactobacillus parafarraginis]